MREAYRWKPIELPPDIATLAIPELRSLIDLWRKERDRLTQSGALGRFTERIARRWSIETGIVERVYDVPMGITMTLVEQGFHASLIPHGETSLAPDELVLILNDHRASLDMVMDVVGGTRELSTAWIKELHAPITRRQPTSTGITPQGQKVEVPLEHGAYKKRPNNPTRPTGTIHEYCPPEHVAAEMDRLVQLYPKIPRELPEVRAAWLHHAFVQIHPFQDGNGRVARALASIDFIRAGLFPLLVDRTDFAKVYIPALEKADAGDLGTLVRYFGDCQKRMLLKAISEAEAAIGPAENFAAVLDAARQKVALQRPLRSSERDQMAARLGRFQREVEKGLGLTARRVQTEVTGIRAVVTASRPPTEDMYEAELLEYADAHGYWADLREERAWVRLQLQDGGRTDLVVTLHFVGNPSPGVLAAGLFLVHRTDVKKPELKKSKRRRVSKVSRLNVTPDQLWSVGEVAKFLKVNRDWVYRRAASGDVPSRKVGTQLRFVRSEVLAWLDSRLSGRLPRARTSTTLTGIEPLVFAPSEVEGNQLLRLSRWLDEATVIALAQWTRYL